MLSRDEIILEYLERLPYPPYPIQEEAMFAWASCDQGLLLSAPTGTGKTLVAEAAVYEGLRTGKSVYYSTPLIALTDRRPLGIRARSSRACHGQPDGQS
jgi:superfamily II RNA helicase